MSNPKLAREGSFAYVLLLTAVAALGGLLFGYDTGVISGAIKYLTAYFKLDEWYEGWAASNVLVGCMIGAATAGALCDRLGRKTVLVISAVLFTVSAVGTAVPTTFNGFVVARMLGGIGVGMASIASPLYIAEVAPPKIRGWLISLNQVTIISGMLLVTIVNWLVVELATRWLGVEGAQQWCAGWAWRWMFGSGVLPALLFLAATFLVPESPRWLTKQGRPHEALTVLARVGGEAEARRQMREIEAAIHEEGGTLRDLLQPGIRVALVIAVVLAVLQQVTGINAVMYYAPKVFEHKDVSATSALLQTVAVQVVNLAMTLIMIPFVDRVGRKPLLLVTSVLMGVSLFFLGWSFHAGWSPEAVFGFTLAYVGSFGLAMGPVVWVVLAEIFPTRTRGRAMSVATAALWVACFTLSQTVPIMFRDIGRAWTFWTYAILCGVTVVFVLLCVPETKGKTLEEIERSWTRGQAR